MKCRPLIGLLFCATFLVPVAQSDTNRSPTAELLDATLGAAPPHYKKAILPDVKKLASVEKLLAQKKNAEARKVLSALAQKDLVKDYALLALSRLEQSSNNPLAALRAITELKRLPLPPSLERIVNERENEVLLQRALSNAKSAKSSTAKKNAAQELRLALERLPFRDWEENMEATELLLSIMKETNDPLWKNQISETLLALPNASPAWKKISASLKPEEIKELTAYPKYKTGSESPAGVKAILPDQDLFDQGMNKVLEEDWTEAEELFTRVLKEFPTSEHTDRAQFWIARMLENRGLEEEAKKRYIEIFQSSPLSYYGLESALRSGQAIEAEIKKTEPKLKPISGALLPRQQLALWRLRAFLETNQLDLARIQMEDLYHYRPNGLFGQEDPNSALSLALLFHWSGYHLGAFTHAYGSTSLDRSLFTEKILDVIFPSAFNEEIEKAATTAQINPLLLQSLVKQESAFLPQAISRSNAMGLMQLLFATAKDVEKTVKREDLFSPEINTRVGTGYLRYLLNRFDGNIALALAGYNAGPTRTAVWQKKLLENSMMKKEFQIDIFIDTIPYTETRRYVGSILRNYWWYRVRAGKPAVKSMQELAQLWQKDEITAKQ